MNIPLPNSDFENSPFKSQQGAEDGPHELLIEALGTSFHIMADKDPAYLDEVLSQYRLAVATTQNILVGANTQGLSGVKDDPLKVAILTGFLLCDAINEQKMQGEADRAKTGRLLERSVQNMIARIDRLIE